MSMVCFEAGRVVRALTPAVIFVLASCGGNGSDTNTSTEISFIAGNRLLASQSVPRQEQAPVPVTDSIVGLLTLIHSQPVPVGTAAAIEIQYIVNALPSPVSSFQMEYADSGLPIEASGCQMLMLQSLFDYGFVCQGDILVNKPNTTIRINLRLQSGQIAYSNNVTLPGS